MPTRDGNEVPTTNTMIRAVPQIIAALMPPTRNGKFQTEIVRTVSTPVPPISAAAVTRDHGALSARSLFLDPKVMTAALVRVIMMMTPMAPAPEYQV